MRILEINMRAFFFFFVAIYHLLPLSLLGVKRSGPVTAAAPVEAFLFVVYVKDCGNMAITRGRCLAQ